MQPGEVSWILMESRVSIEAKEPSEFDTVAQFSAIENDYSLNFHHNFT